jgi:hypothetical protein
MLRQALTTASVVGCRCSWLARRRYPLNCSSLNEPTLVGSSCDVEHRLINCQMMPTLFSRMPESEWLHSTIMYSGKITSVTTSFRQTSGTEIGKLEHKLG